jgi:hypothetical protein
MSMKSCVALSLVLFPRKTPYNMHQHGILRMGVT